MDYTFYRLIVLDNFPKYVLEGKFFQNAIGKNPQIKAKYQDKQSQEVSQEICDRN